MVTALLRQSLSKPWMLIAPICVAVVATGLVIGALLYWSALQVDRASAARETDILSRAVTRSADRVAKEQEASTVWDDAVRYVNAPDLDWLDANLGIWMHTYYGHDEAYIVNGRDEPVYAMLGGVRVATDTVNSAGSTIAGLVHELRQKLVAGAEPAGPDLQTSGAQDIAVIGGHPAIVSAKPIVSDTGEIEQAPGTEAVHISVRYLDGDFTERLAANYRLQDARFSWQDDRGANQVAFPYKARDGSTVGYLIWSPYLPGSSVRYEVQPALAAALVGIALIIGLLAYALRSGAAALERSEARARHLAEHDSLTDLPNRMLFNERLQRLLDHARSARADIALLSLDLDRFKQVNDSLGHPAGDELLRQVGARLCRAVRGSDTVARIGGDEFAIILPNADDRLIDKVCQRLLATVREPFAILADTASIGLSIGVAVAPKDATDKGQLIRRSDLALYAAKQRGRGRYERFTKALDAPAEPKREAAAGLPAIPLAAGFSAG